jgi:hemolysin-activating ACP:hemolysin acyltransferase
MTNYEQLLVEVLEFRAANRLDLPHRQLLALRNSALAGTLRIFRDALSRPIGYVAWAGICRENAHRLLRRLEFAAYPYEWTEGNIRYVVDIVLLQKERRSALRQLRAAFSKSRALLVERRDRVRLYTRHRGIWRLRQESEARKVEVSAAVPAAARG